MAIEKAKAESGDKDPRQAKWELFVENYKKQNPVKFATKQANKEFDKIPASFR